MLELTRSNAASQHSDAFQNLIVPFEQSGPGSISMGLAGGGAYDLARISNANKNGNICYISRSTTVAYPELGWAGEFGAAIGGTIGDAPKAEEENTGEE